MVFPLLRNDEIVIIEHLQSSTQILDLGNIKILTDPWLTEGEYYGSWYHYPPFEESKIKDLEYDYIYVSHIHPDHCSEATMLKLDKNTPVLIAKFEHKALKSKLERFGFKVIELAHAEPLSLGNDCSIEIFLADNCDPKLCMSYFGCQGGLDQSAIPRSIDSLALFKSAERSILNTNDCPFDLAFKVINLHPQLHNVDMLLVGYCGAGPYPQCFVLSENRLQEEIQNKKIIFMNSAIKYIDLVKPRFYAPFAGTYILGGSITGLNKSRGVPSIKEAITYIQHHIETNADGILLEAGSKFDLISGNLISQPELYLSSVEDYTIYIKKKKFDYGEVSFDCSNEDHMSLLLKSWKRFRQNAVSLGAQNTFTYLKFRSSYICFSMTEKPKIVDTILHQERIIIALDERLLFSLLSGPRYAHWNNAEIGSHLTFDRGNLDFDRSLNFAMNFLHA